MCLYLRNLDWKLRSFFHCLLLNHTNLKEFSTFRTKVPQVVSACQFYTADCFLNSLVRIAAAETYVVEGVQCWHKRTVFSSTSSFCDLPPRLHSHYCTRLHTPTRWYALLHAATCCLSNLRIGSNKHNKENTGVSSTNAQENVLRKRKMKA